MRQRVCAFRCGACCRAGTPWQPLSLCSFLCFFLKLGWSRELRMGMRPCLGASAGREGVREEVARDRQGWQGGGARFTGWEGVPQW